jgi:hypothetical protein
VNGDAKGSGRRRGRTGARGWGLAALAALALAVPAGAFALVGRQHGADIPISLGDVVKVTGAPIGCIVRQHNGERTLDCRRAGQLRGTYGTLLTKSEVLVVRFESPKLAKIVFQARHDHLGARMCGSR